MFKIYVARHGQDTDNAAGILNGRRDAPLSETGVEQARDLARSLQELKLPIKKIYSSPLQRAYRTAEIVADALHLPKPERIDLLIEREFGIMTGLSIKDVEKLCAPDIIKTDPVVYFLSPEGAETYPQLLARAEKLLRSLTAGDLNQDILLVCHSDIGKMLYTAFYRLDWKEVLREFHYGNSEVLVLAPDSKPNERRLHIVEQYNH